MDKEVLEVVLKKFEWESRISSIIDIESVPALPKGENYTSTISRVTLKVVLANGRIAKKSFIMKQIITEGAGGELMNKNKVAKQESEIYTVVLKHMNYLMEEFDDHDEPLGCNFIHYDPRLSCVLLEDLKASGYSVVPRQESLDLDHAILALRGLGRYHGMAKVLEERGIISKDNYMPYGFFSNVYIIKCFPYAGVLNTAQAMLESWGPDWEGTARKMMMSFDDFYPKLMKSVPDEESQFTVLNHGDCWSNNMMFKYDFQKRPITVKFLDFQGPHYSSHCVDVINLFYLSVQPAIRRGNYELLVKTYHDSLARTLDKFGFTGIKPTLEEITSTLKRLEFFGLTIFIAIYAAAVAISNKTFDLEKILKTEGKEGFIKDTLMEPGVIEKMGPDISYYVQEYLNDLK